MQSCNMAVTVMHWPTPAPARYFSNARELLDWNMNQSFVTQCYRRLFSLWPTKDRMVRYKVCCGFHLFPSFRRHHSSSSQSDSTLIAHEPFPSPLANQFLPSRYSFITTPNGVPQGVTRVSSGGFHLWLPANCGWQRIFLGNLWSFHDREHLLRHPLPNMDLSDCHVIGLPRRVFGICWSGVTQ